MSYDETGVRCTMLRGGTSRGLYFEATDLPAEPAARDDLLLRLMGTPDPRQIDGLGGATTLTSKVAVVSPSDDPDVDVDYLFLQLGVDEATVSDLQNCGNILAGVGPFAVERGLVPAGDAETSVRIRMVNSDSVAVATFPTPGGARRVPRGRRDRRRPGHGRARRPRLRRHRGVGHRRAAAHRARPGHGRGHRGHLRRQRHAGRPGPRRVVRAHRVRAARAAGRRRGAARADRRLPPQGRRSSWGWATSRRASVPKTVLLAAPRDGGQVCTRSFIPVQPHTSIGVLGAVSVVTGMLLPGAVGHELTADWPRDTSQVDVEHPTGHLLVDVVVDSAVTPPRVVRSGVVRTARKLFDGTAFPRA